MLKQIASPSTCSPTPQSLSLTSSATEHQCLASLPHHPVSTHTPPSPLQIMEEVEERIRRFAEEASSLEGFQVLCDPWSPWSGVTAACTAVLADDYPTQTRVLFSTRAPLDHDAALMHELAATGALSGALSAARWMADCSLLVPLDPPPPPPASALLRLDPSRPFHTAAAAAAALDCCSLPWRVAPMAAASGRGAAAAGGAPSLTPSAGATTMAAWAAGLTSRGANIAATGSVFPAVSVPFAAAAEADERLSARERRLRGLSAEAQPAVPPELVSSGLQWALSDACNPLDSALPSPLMRPPVQWCGAALLAMSSTGVSAGNALCAVCAGGAAHFSR